MSSVSVLSTSSLRTATRPHTYIHLVARSYSGLTVTKLGSSHDIRGHTSSFTYTPKRSISSTSQNSSIVNNLPKHTNCTTNQIKEFFPPPQTRGVKEVESAWAHPVYSESEMKNVAIAHRNAANWSDWVALGTVRVFRWGMDLVTGYKHPEPGEELAARFKMTETKWMHRFIFLETVAGVPGMVGGMLRHLRSLRRMKRDNGWIETLLEEAFNERMHLLTFLKLAEPGWFMRLMVLGAQGVFFNGFFIAYLLSPRICHRFVGYLEEEAVITYTRAIEELETGKLPEWETLEAPQIAVQYWKMPEGQRTMKDLLMYIRADEAKHREVNHTLGNLQQAIDPNPYQTRYRDPSREHPSKGLSNLKGTGWEREDIF